MTLSIEQTQEYIGGDRWKWSAWVKGSRDELDKIEIVTWHLHPSFRQSVVVVRERATGFRIDRSGWGTFTLRAELRFADGTQRLVRHDLQLFYPSDDPVQSMKPVEARSKDSQLSDQRGTKVFLSFASSDRRAAMEVRRVLENSGVNVLDETAIDPGVPFERAALELQSGADATVAFVSSELPSAFVAQQINASVSFGKPTLMITTEDLGQIAGVPRDVQVMRIGSSDFNEVSSTLSELLSSNKTA